MDIQNFAWTDSNDSKKCKKGAPKDDKKNNILLLWGNVRTMNLNPLILENIRTSYYFKVDLRQLKTYHEVVDEIYYRVNHLEPWEKGSRNTSGLTALCGGVRGVGAGGIVSTAFCLLYKMFTLKLTRKQVNGLISHPDSPYIRGLGFMYIRYTQPPQDLWGWFENYLSDVEEIDVKAGGGHVMTIGEMLKRFLTKHQWFSTFFPRIPQPIQQTIDKSLSSNSRIPVKRTTSLISDSDIEYNGISKQSQRESKTRPYSANNSPEGSGISNFKRRHSSERESNVSNKKDRRHR